VIDVFARAVGELPGAAAAAGLGAAEMDDGGPKRAGPGWPVRLAKATNRKSRAHPGARVAFLVFPL
jgi:hypothetical protein